MLFSRIALLAPLFSLASAALAPIEVRGNAFYPKGSDERFYIKGIDYQPGGESKAKDPLMDKDTCTRDIKYFKELGVNVIRIYTVDNSADHSECMKALDDASIYLILDVNSPAHSLDRSSEETLKISYNSDYLQHVFATIDTFKGYPNLLGFFAANEVINEINNTIAAPYIKAVVRDMKRYISKQADREIPVGYSAADIKDSRWEQMEYFNCGKDEERVDMFGFNDYAWCGERSSFKQSGWEDNVERYSNYSIPLFLSEFGCNKNRPRTFPEVEALFSDKMSAVYSGGLVYEYSEEENNYGIVRIVDGKVQPMGEFDNLKKAFDKVSTPSGSGGAKESGSASECPAKEEGVWEVANPNLPLTPKYAERYFKDGAGKAKGLAGNTQWGSNHDKEDSSNWSYMAGDNAPKSSTRGAGESGSKTKSGSKTATKDAASASDKHKSSSDGVAAFAVPLSAPLLGLITWLW